MATLPDGRTVPAEFKLQGASTYIKVHLPTVSRNFFHDLHFLPLAMPDGTRLTFVDNVLTSAEMRHPAGGSTQNLMPHFVTVGAAHMTDTSRFKALGLLVSDATTLFTDFDAFAMLIDPEHYIDALIDAQEKAAGRRIERGEHPLVAYFTGKSEIVAADTILGRVSANNRPSYSIGGPRGVGIENRVYIDLDFPAPAAMADVTDHLMPLLRFLQVVAGRRQKIEHLWGQLESEEQRAPLDILWCLSPGRYDDDDQKPQPRDLPLNGGYEPEAFAKVMTAWLAEDGARRDARLRFAGVFAGRNRYDIDRLVGAANMFDILPKGCFPVGVDMPEDVTATRDKARELFKALPASTLRDRALGDLGRLGKPNLKSKVRHRASIVLPVTAGRFPDLELVLDQAVDARNHYVHGSDASVARAHFYNQTLAFHTETLEFVFAVSEFVEAGWHFGSWASHGTTMSHPWGTYVVSYAERLADFKKQLSSSKD